MKDFTIEETAEKFSAVYIDSAITDRDIKRPGKKSPPREVSSAGVTKMMRDIPTLSEIDVNHLRAKQGLATSIQRTVTNNPSIRSTRHALSEYHHFLFVLKKDVERLSNNLDTDSDEEKELLLTYLAASHQRIYQILKERSPRSEKADVLTDYLIQEEMHKPRGPFFKKRTKNIKEWADRGDASLASHAILSAAQYEGDAAVITADFDILNLVWNFSTAYHTGRLPEEIKKGLVLQGPVNVYFPNREEWNAKLSLDFMCNTQGKYTSTTNWWRKEKPLQEERERLSA